MFVLAALLLNLLNVPSGLELLSFCVGHGEVRTLFVSLRCISLKVVSVYWEDFFVTAITLFVDPMRCGGGQYFFRSKHTTLLSRLDG